MPTTVPIERITSKIYFIHGQKVILDRDLAELYGVETRVLKQAVRRNVKRFPSDFMFELKTEEEKALRSQFVTLKRGQHSIAGFQYYDSPALVHRLRPGEGLVYSLEFENVHVQEHTYRGIKGVHPGRLKPGTLLKLTRGPRNPHDPFAVEIHLDKAKLGYVPRSDNKHISRLLEQGAKLECRVAEVDLEAEVWNMVKVEVLMV